VGCRNEGRGDSRTGASLSRREPGKTPRSGSSTPTGPVSKARSPRASEPSACGDAGIPQQVEGRHALGGQGAGQGPQPAHERRSTDAVSHDVSDDQAGRGSGRVRTSSRSPPWHAHRGAVPGVQADRGRAHDHALRQGSRAATDLGVRAAREGCRVAAARHRFPYVTTDPKGMAAEDQCTSRNTTNAGGRSCTGRTPKSGRTRRPCPSDVLCTVWDCGEAAIAAPAGCMQQSARRFVRPLRSKACPSAPSSPGPAGGSPAQVLGRLEGARPDPRPRPFGIC
jgi:hypothetical protein